MQLALLTLVAFIYLSCGGDETDPAPSQPTPALHQKQANRPPILPDPKIHPDSPPSDQDLSVSVKPHDRDGDPLRIEVAWYRNGIRSLRGESLTLPASYISRGDEVHALVHVSDGVVTVSGRTQTVKVRNQVPIIDEIEILPKVLTATDAILAVVKASDPDNDTFELSYRWYVNGSELHGASEAMLKPGRVRRGSVIVVEARASDDYGNGSPARSLPHSIANSAPKILSKPRYGLEGYNEYRYQVETSDPDGDRPLRFRLVESPPGMTIGLVSGLVSWTVPDDADGKYPVALSVSDPHGGETRQSYVLELRWATPPADTP